ncbi:hypothetical protein N9B82_06300 [Saprospiraceae bacterium]|nr:hypothetical protein [Saprospiraceae bacterium]
MKKLLFLVFITVIAFSCNDQTEPFELDAFGYDYYPVEQGMYWIYQVDSVVYSDLGAVKDTTRSYLKEEIVERFIDQLGDTIFRIEREFSPTIDYDWKVKDEWATHKEPNRVTRTEENLKYIKLVFPPKENVSWDGNSFIPEGTDLFVGGETLDFFLNWSYKILSVDQAENIAGVDYDEVVTIQNADSDEIDLLHRRYAVEKFAKNVGLVHKKHIILDTQCIVDCEGQTWEEKGEKGYTMEITLIEYGG